MQRNEIEKRKARGYSGILRAFLLNCFEIVKINVVDYLKKKEKKAFLISSVLLTSCRWHAFGSQSLKQQSCKKY